MTANLSVLSLIGGMRGAMLFAGLAMTHVEAATPHSDGFDTPTTDSETDSPA